MVSLLLSPEGRLELLSCCEPAEALGGASISQKLGAADRAWRMHWSYASCSEQVGEPHRRRAGGSGHTCL